MTKKTVNITITDAEVNVRDELEKVADANGRSMSKQALRFVKYCLERRVDNKVTTKEKQ